MNGYFLTTEHWKMLLASDQRYLGYLIIKTKEQRSTLPELTEAERSDFFKLIEKLENFYKEKIGATMFNYSCLMNNAYRDGETPHVHFHFRPRYKAPVMVLGQEFSDPNFGEHYINASTENNGEVSIPREIREYLTQELTNYFNQ